MRARKDTEIQTPFLRYFLNYYGNLSHQLTPVVWTQWTSVLRLVWNLALIGVLYFVLFVQSGESLNYESEVQRDPRLERVIQTRPLFGLIFRLGLQLIFKLSFVLTLGYFVWLSIQGQGLVQCLDSFQTFQALNNNTNNWPIGAGRQVLALIALDHLQFLAINHQAMLQDWAHTSAPSTQQQPTLFDQVLSQAGNYGREYVLNLHKVIPFMLLVYGKCCTLQWLRGLSHSIQSTEESSRQSFTRQSFAQYERQLHLLADLNVQLSGLLSFPLCISMFNYVLDLVIVGSCLFIHDVPLGLYAYLLPGVALFTTVATLDRAINRQLVDLVDHLRDHFGIDPLILRRHANLSAGSQSSHFSFENRGHKYWTGTSSGTTKGVCGQTQSADFERRIRRDVHIRCQELSQLLPARFRLRPFQLCTFNFEYILGVVLFIANYVVLITQTSL